MEVINKIFFFANNIYNPPWNSIFPYLINMIENVFEDELLLCKGTGVTLTSVTFLSINYTLLSMNVKSLIFMKDEHL